MSVIINGLLLNGRFSGVQYAIEYLLLALQQERDVPAMQYALPRGYSGSLDASRAIVPKIDSSSRLQRILWENIVLPFQLRKGKHTLYHAPGYVLPLWCPARAVVTIHDLIALKHPEWCRNESAVYFRLFLPWAIRRADRIIAVSEAVKQDIIKSYAVPAEKIAVVYHGVRPGFRPVTDMPVLNRIKAAYDLPEKYLLFVGNLEPKKNIARLIAAFSLLRQQGFGTLKLVIAGQKGWKYNDIFKTIKSLGLQQEVQFAGYVPEADLPGLYSLAAVFAFPSLYEGFGLPVLEAMACGVPVVISDRGALPEIAGDAALQVDPYDVTALAAAVSRLLTDQRLREEMRAKGRRRAADFSWEKAARDMAGIYRNMQEKC